MCVYDGNVPPDRWVGWLLELCDKWQNILGPDGSMMIKIGPVFKEGLAAQQLQVERLLVKLEDELGIHLLQHEFCMSREKVVQTRD